MKVKVVCELLSIVRSNIYSRLRDKSASKTLRDSLDGPVLAQIKETVRERPFYGYRRVAAMLNKGVKQRMNEKRVYRIMSENKLHLSPFPKKTTPTHDGKIITLASNLRWCSDHFDICWNGDIVRVIFSLDFHDR